MLVITSPPDVTATSISQLSLVVALAGLKTGTSVAQETVVFAGHPITGGVLSVTEIVCIQLAVFPQMSVAVQVRRMVFSCGQLPGIIISTGTTGGDIVQLSVAVAVPVLAGAVLSEHSMVTLAGQVIDGGTSSSTLMDWAQVALLPHSSVALHVLINAAGHMPPIGPSVKEIIGVPLQLTVAVAMPVVPGVFP